MQNTLDQLPDGAVGFGPVDCDCKSAHAPYPRYHRRWLPAVCVLRLNGDENRRSRVLQVAFTIIGEG
jgi:hypothetical protein